MAAAFSDLQQRVKYATKNVATGDTILPLIKDAINMAYLDCVVEFKPTEFLYPRLEVAVAASGALLPIDFIQEDTVFYKDVSNANREHRLLPRGAKVPPAPLFGLPRWYYVVGSNNPASPNISQMLFGPTTLIDGAVDKIYLTYWMVPARLVADADTLRSTWLHSEIEKRAIHFLHTYSNDLNKAQEILSISLKRMSNPQPTASS